MPDQKADKISPCEFFLDAVRIAVREEIKAMRRDEFQKPSPANPISEAAKPYLTVIEAADLSRLAPSTIRLYIRKGRLKAQKIGSRVIIKRNDLEKFIEVNTK